MEIPWLIAMQDKYGPKGFTVLGIAMDEEGKPVVAPFVAKERYDVNGQTTADELSHRDRQRYWWRKNSAACLAIRPAY